PQLTLEETITSLFQSLKLDPAASAYIDPSGTHHEGSKNPVWKEPLGKKVLIVDIDTRKPTGKNELLNPGRIDWEHIGGEGGGMVSNSILNHYMYAMIHGYEYMFYQARDMDDRHNTWVLPHVVRELLPKYQFVVVLDADAMVPHLEIPLEWMFNRWGIKEETSIALPWDTEEFRSGGSISADSKGLRVLNTGLVIAQNSTNTLEMLEAWRDCPTETRYKGCAEWKFNWSHEQRAFFEYLRYDYNDTIVAIPCEEAVGWPGFREEMLAPGSFDDDISDCNGTFIRHYTARGKPQVREAGGISVMQLMTEVIQKSILSNPNKVWYKEPKHNPDPPKITRPKEQDKSDQVKEEKGIHIEIDVA
ncbi:uncharacterized protein SETTUDRAFT_94644, partial [Exserohilum turcica Et28A]